MPDFSKVCHETFNFLLLCGSVGDPNPHLFGPLVRGMDPDPSFSHKGVERTEIMLAK